MLSNEIRSQAMTAAFGLPISLSDDARWRALPMGRVTGEVCSYQGKAFLSGIAGVTDAHPTPGTPVWSPPI